MSGPAIFLTHTPQELRLFYDGAALDHLRALGQVILNPREDHLSSPALLEAAGHCQIVISEWGTGADRGFFSQAGHLLAFVRCGVELRNVDIEAATAEGVLVVNTPGHYVTAVVELVLGFMICLARDVVNRSVRLRAGTRPEDRFGTELRGKILGLIGYGDVARGLARAAHHLGMRVLFADPYVPGGDGYATPVALDHLLSQADFVSLHAKWTAETQGMLGAEAFRKMKPTAFFINTARGALVDEAALLTALREGWIAGAALDVFGNEPGIVGNPLLALPNVIATPHIGGITPETVRAQVAHSVRIVQEILAGRIPASTVNARAIGRPRLRDWSRSWARRIPPGGPRRAVAFGRRAEGKEEGQ